jgi:DNA-binding GntR family transcriptional regulator
MPAPDVHDANRRPARRRDSGRVPDKPGKSLSRMLVKRPLSDQTYEALRELILDQGLRPGSRLNVDRLARELGVSSSPVREALARLEAERLVVSEMYSGYSVAPEPTLTYLRDLLSFRIVLEGHCARIGAERRDPQVITALRAAVDDMAKTRRLGRKYKEYRRFVATDARFHQAIVDSAGNEVISGVYASMHAILLQSRLYLNRQAGSARADEVGEEHARILKAFEAGDADAAEIALRRHLEGGKRRLLNVPTADQAPAPRGAAHKPIEKKVMPHHALTGAGWRAKSK